VRASFEHFFIFQSFVVGNSFSTFAQNMGRIG